MKRSPLNGGTGRAVTADERRKLVDLAAAEIDSHVLADQLQRLAELLRPEPEWLPKPDAADLLGVTFNVVRGRCRRRTVRARFDAGVEMVNVADLRRALAVRPYRPQPATSGRAATVTR